jgi:hypothetical protein
MQMTMTETSEGPTRLFFVHRETARMYRELRAKHELTPAVAILQWVRDIVNFRRKHEKLPAMECTYGKYKHHTYQGIEFAYRVDIDNEDPQLDGHFSNEKKSKWSIKNREHWEETKLRGYSHHYEWWNPAEDPEGDLKCWRAKPYCLSKSTAYEKTLAMVREMYKNACNSERFDLVVKVYLKGAKLGEASLGGLDRNQIEGEDSKTTLMDVLTEAIHDSQAALDAITKSAASFRRTARRF